MFDINQCEKIEIPQGALYLGSSDITKSVGYLELNPRTSLVLHNRPAIEQLTQVQGVCEMFIHNGTEGSVIVLRESDQLRIPAHTWHIHVNPFDVTSITYWDFDGDITHIIDEICKSKKS